MRIQHNIPAMNAYRNYNANTKALQGNLQKLSSGYKINKAGDDAAGLAISEKMRAQITGLEVAQKNAKDGISLVQTAEGAMTEIHTMLNRMFSLAEQSANGTYNNAVDREQLDAEFQQLTEEIDRIADATNFNGKKLLNGDLDGEIPDSGDKTEVTPVEASVDSANDAAKVTVSSPFAFSADATADDQTAINDILKANSLDISLTANAANAGFGSGNAVDLGTALDTALQAKGYKLQVKDASNAFTDVTNVTTSGAAANTSPITGTLEFQITDTAGTKVLGTIGVDLPTGNMTNANAANVTKINFAEPATMIDNAELDATGGNKNLKTDYGIEKINFGTTEVAEGAEVKVGFGNGGNTDVLTVEVGGTTFSSATLTGSGYAGDVTLTDAVSGDTITVTLAAGQNVLADGNTIASDSVGTTKAAAATVEEDKGPLRLRVGDSTEKYDNIYVAIKSLKKDALTGMDGTDTAKNTTTLADLNVLTASDADTAMNSLKDMINYVSNERGKLGATQNRLDHTINNLSTMQENIQDAESTIRDVDVAEEMMKYTKNNILVQSAQAMLAQANQLPQGVLQLLG